jgi:hypothetical protein
MTHLTLFWRVESQKRERLKTQENANTRKRKTQENAPFLAATFCPAIVEVLLQRKTKDPSLFCPSHHPQKVCEGLPD